MGGKYKDNIIVRNRYYRGAGKGKGRSAKAVGQKLSNHFKYLEHRPMDEEKEQREDRHIFNAESDYVNRKDAVNDVMENRSGRVDYHHLVLSPDPQEPVSDLRQWTRDVMNDFAAFKGQDITWYAVQHYNTDHDHVHVVIAGGGAVEGQDQDKREAVTIFEDERDMLHESAFRHSDHELYKEMQELHQQDLLELQQEIKERDFIHTMSSHGDGIER